MDELSKTQSYLQDEIDLIENQKEMLIDAGLDRNSFWIANCIAEITALKRANNHIYYLESLLANKEADKTPTMNITLSKQEG